MHSRICDGDHRETMEGIHDKSSGADERVRVEEAVDAPCTIGTRPCTFGGPISRLLLSVIWPASGEQRADDVMVEVANAVLQGGRQRKIA